MRRDRRPPGGPQRTRDAVQAAHGRANVILPDVAAGTRRSAPNRSGAPRRFRTPATHDWDMIFMTLSSSCRICLNQSSYTWWITMNRCSSCAGNPASVLFSDWAPRTCRPMEAASTGGRPPSQRAIGRTAHLVQLQIVPVVQRIDPALLQGRARALGQRLAAQRGQVNA